jgi:hypothetical protein
MDDEIRRKQKQKNRDRQAYLYPNRRKRKIDAQTDRWIGVQDTQKQIQRRIES